ncbi:MAG TPA: putative metal-binding motif-containing protein [Verrucomicrobiae bacterium]|nr:putative metal-binding motif-containing protein [Verrucomicrobiae bacterium]
MSRSLRRLAPCLLALAALVLTPAPDPSAATPQTIKVQGSLTDRASGNPLPAQGAYNMTFALFDAEFGGLPITTIGPLSVDVQQGRFQVDLPLSTGQFQLPDRYLQITVGGETLTPRVRLTSAPYALVSDQAATASSSSTAAVAMNVAAGAVGTSGLADGAVTAPKLGIPCQTGEILIRDTTGWTCRPAPGGAICVPGSYVTCYTGPAGTQGVGTCKAGASACNAAGTAFEGCAGQTLPATEVCDAKDNDCDGSVDEENVCPPCPDADQDGSPDAACTGGTDCNDQNPAIHPGQPELCNGLDDDCNPQTNDGSADPGIGAPCDGADGDHCIEGIRFCTGGTLACNDTTPTNPEVCNGVDDDCDGVVPANEADQDGDGFRVCNGDCLDTNPTVHPGGTELCDGFDNDCNPATTDGSQDPQAGAACDGPDADFCPEGVRACSPTSHTLVCNDTTGDNREICNGIDDDCNPSTPDGSQDTRVGACDGPDSDKCVEGHNLCVNGVITCDDNTGDNLDLCNGIEDDCDLSSPDGSEDPLVGTPCDGPDSDLCKEGIYFCSGGALGCNDNSGNNPELCGNGIDDDCDGAVDEGC